jgi:hypothetical protein
MYAAYELNSDFIKSNTLSFPISPNTYPVDVKISGVYDVLLSGATQHTKMNVRLMADPNQLLEQRTYTISGSPATYSFTHSFDPLSRQVARVDVAFSGTSLTGNSINRIYWNGNLDVYKDRWRFVTGETTFWTGYVQPDRLSRKFLNSSYYISLSAVDGINDWKQLPYPPDQIGIGSGFKREIFMLQDAIYQNGFTDIPIRSQVNLQANGITTYQSTFNNVAANTYRFIKSQKDGKTTYTNCYDAVSWLIEPYTARLAHSKGGWAVTNLNEIASVRSSYSPSDFTPLTTGYSRIVNVSGSSLIAGTDDLSKIKANKQLNITFFNKSVPNQMQTNADFQDGTDGWTNAPFPNNFYSFSSSGSELHCVVTAPPLASDPTKPHWFTGPEFVLLYASGTTAKVSVTADLHNVQFSGTTSNKDNPYIDIAVTRNGGSTAVAHDYGTRMQPGYHIYEFEFPIQVSDVDYQITITISPDSSTKYKLIDVRFSHIGCTQTFPALVTLDKYYIATNTDNSAINVIEQNLYFCDAVGLTDVGVLKTSVTGLTNSWSNYGEINNLPLISLYAKNKLKMSNKFKNYLNLMFLRNDINIDSVLPIKGKLYYPVSLTHDIGNSKIAVSLVELLTDNINVSIVPTTLASIDGDL